MPFSKHEVVPDVIPAAPKGIARVNYVSGGEKIDGIYLSVILFLF
jgi:hypothetical protein